MKPYRTYGKKGKKRLDKQQQRAATVGRPDDAESEGSSGKNSGLLVRPGEGIIVDWDENAFDMVFGGTGAPDGRGVRTYNDVDTLRDPTIEASKARRQMRQKHGISLDDCLAEFEKPEVLSEQDTWFCPRCKDHRRATKKFDLWKTPDILVVHLKRFSSNSWSRNKIDTLVGFPIEGLDLTQRVIDKTDGKEEVFDLIAVDNHWGGLGGGHYTASAKNFIDGEWYDYNGMFVFPDPGGLPSS
jgi:ubiquitin carboxyl-terminal hydrolase 4/11/15